MDPVLIATVCPFRSANDRMGESFRTMMPCGSCCIVAATATSGCPSETASRICVRRSHAKLRAARGHLLRDANVWAAGLDGYVEAFVLVVALHQRVIKAAVLGLRIPVRLQRYFCQAGLGRGMAASQRAQRAQ